MDTKCCVTVNNNIIGMIFVYRNYHNDVVNHSNVFTSVLTILLEGY